MRPGKFKTIRCCADAFHRRVHAAKGIHRPAETGGAAGIFRHLHAGCHEDFPDRLLIPMRRLEIVDDFRSGRHTEGIDDYFLAAQDARHFHELAGRATGARTHKGAIQFGTAHFFRQLALAGVRMTGDRGFKFGKIDGHLVNKLFIPIPLHRLIGGFGAV